MCRKILSNYNSTAFFASVFRQEFSPRFFDSKFRHHLTNFYGNRQIFCRLLSNFVENYCRKILSKLRQHFSTRFFAKFGRHSTFFASIRQIFLSNVVELCLKMLSKTAVEFFDSTVRQSFQEAWSIFVEDCRIVAKLCFYKIRQKKLKKESPVWGIPFIILCHLNL